MKQLRVKTSSKQRLNSLIAIWNTTFTACLFYRVQVVFHLTLSANPSSTSLGDSNASSSPENSPSTIAMIRDDRRIVTATHQSLVCGLLASSSYTFHVTAFIDGRQSVLDGTAATVDGVWTEPTDRPFPPKFVSSVSDSSAVIELTPYDVIAWHHVSTYFVVVRVVADGSFSSEEYVGRNSVSPVANASSDVTDAPVWSPGWYSTIELSVDELNRTRMFVIGDQRTYGASSTVNRPLVPGALHAISLVALVRMPDGLLVESYSWPPTLIRTVIGAINVNSSVTDVTMDWTTLTSNRERTAFNDDTSSQSSSVPLSSLNYTRDDKIGPVGTSLPLATVGPMNGSNSTVSADSDSVDASLPAVIDWSDTATSDSVLVTTQTIRTSANSKVSSILPISPSADNATSVPMERSSKSQSVTVAEVARTAAATLQPSKTTPPSNFPLSTTSKSQSTVMRTTSSELLPGEEVVIDDLSGKFIYKSFQQYSFAVFALF